VPPHPAFFSIEMSSHWPGISILLISPSWVAWGGKLATTAPNFIFEFWHFLLLKKWVSL
jgi:hypothetical protein